MIYNVGMMEENETITKLKGKKKGKKQKKKNNQDILILMNVINFFFNIVTFKKQF